MWAVVHLDIGGDTSDHWRVIVDAPNARGLVFAVLFLYCLSQRCLHCWQRGWERVAGAFCFYPARGVLETLVRLVGWYAAALTVLAYTIYFAQTVALARGLNLPLGASDIIASIVLVGLASFCPYQLRDWARERAGWP